MFIIRDTVSGKAGDVLPSLRRFSWPNGDQGFNGKPGLIHGDEKIYGIDIVTTGAGDEVRESEPVYDADSDTFTVTRTLSDPALTDQRKAAFRDEVNRAAGEARLQYITPGDGQAMSYREKLDEAKACLAAYATEPDFTNANPPAGTYPLLESEVGIKGANPWKVAELVNTTFLAWKTAEAAINNLRLRAANDLDAAATVGAARTIVEAINWPRPAS